MHELQAVHAHFAATFAAESILPAIFKKEPSLGMTNITMLLLPIKTSVGKLGASAGTLARALAARALGDAGCGTAVLNQVAGDSFEVCLDGYDRHFSPPIILIHLEYIDEAYCCQCIQSYVINFIDWPEIVC